MYNMILKIRLLLITLFVSMPVYSEDFKLICRTINVVQKSSDAVNNQTKDSDKSVVGQTIVIKKKVDLLVYIIIQMNDDKYDGLIQMIPIKKEDGDKIFASIVRTDHMESIVIDREKEDITMAIQSSNEIAAKYGNCFTDDD